MCNNSARKVPFRRFEILIINRLLTLKSKIASGFCPRNDIILSSQNGHEIELYPFFFYTILATFVCPLFRVQFTAARSKRGSTIVLNSIEFEKLRAENNPREQNKIARERFVFTSLISL